MRRHRRRAPNTPRRRVRRLAGTNGGARAAQVGSTPASQSREARRLDTVSLDLIENALRNARHEMDAVLFRSAMSPVIREQHDEFPMICDVKGRMIVGQFGSYVSNMLKQSNFELEPGDVILQNDPYACAGAISHLNDWMVLVPVFHEGDLVGFTSMFGHMMDVGGAVPGSMPTDAASIFGEGIRIPPIKLYERGELNKAALERHHEQYPHAGDELLRSDGDHCRLPRRREARRSRFATASAAKPTSRPARRCSNAPTARCAS